MDIHVVYKYSFEGYKPEIDYYLRNGLYLLVTAAVCYLGDILRICGVL